MEYNAPALGDDILQDIQNNQTFWEIFKNRNFQQHTSSKGEIHDGISSIREKISLLYIKQFSNIEFIPNM